MNPVRSVKNQYRGVNAHLHSFWQETGTWNRFHNPHVDDLMRRLKKQLIPMGYTAQVEDSIQIRRFDEPPRQPRADVLIGDLNQYRGKPGAVPNLGGTMLALEALLEAEEDRAHPYSAVLIAKGTIEALEPVGWVELLSPSNKRGNDTLSYLAKRRELLQQGMIFVEIDYLHETPPTLWNQPDYTRRQPQSHPYRIAVLVPRPDIVLGAGFVHAFSVDQPIPTVKIPLSGADVLEFDFDAAYQQTFEGALYGYDMDYRQLPRHFDRYSPADQARIAARMVAVLRAARAGANLEAAPPPVEDIPLDAALAEIAALTEA
jgi:hypothetical protein